MRFVAMINSDERTEAGAVPSQEELAAMGRYNEELVKAGVMLGGEGLQPSSKGVRITFDGESSTVTDGPFSEAKELVAGFWIWQVKSKEEAIEWAKRCPLGPGAVMDLRRVFEADDFSESGSSAS